MSAAGQLKRLALSLYDQLEPYPDAEWRELLGYAATLLDAGRSIDYYRRLTHAAAPALGPPAWASMSCDIVSNVPPDLVTAQTSVWAGFSFASVSFQSTGSGFSAK